jgi:carboxyl-terminal processing protease
MRGARTPPELLFAIGFACGVLTLGTIRTFLRDRDVELFRAVRDLALETHVEDHDPRELLDDALSGMLTGLDRYSRYYPPADIEALQRETYGEYFGIGVLFLDADRGLIRFPLPDSPAERAGLRPGDRLVRIDGEWVADLPPGGVRELLQRRDRAEIELVVENRAGERRTTSLTPAQVLDPSVRHARMIPAPEGEPTIGYAALTSFTSRTPDELDQAIAWLRTEGMQGLVLDLRANPGGMLDAALRIADRFLDEGVLVSTRSRTETRSTRATPEATRFAGLPLVLLVDGDSASASEVLCGALQDHRAAVVVGEPTYGKGAVQTLTPYDGARVKITTSHYFTPAGRRIERDEERSGLAPDALVELAPGERRELHAFLGGYSPPPSSLQELAAWEAEEELALLPRPPQDLQLEAAVDLLLGRAPDALAQRDGG